MEQKAPFNRKQSEGKHQKLPDQDFCQILSIFG